MDKVTCYRQLERLGVLAKEAGIVGGSDSDPRPSKALEFARGLILELDEAGVCERMKSDPEGTRSFGAVATYVNAEIQQGVIQWGEGNAVEETSPFYWMCSAVIDFCEGLKIQRPDAWS